MSAIKATNLLSALPGAEPDERFESLVRQPGFHLERILSWGHVTPEGEWYDQVDNEWVLLLSGGA